MAMEAATMALIAGTEGMADTAVMARGMAATAVMARGMADTAVMARGMDKVMGVLQFIRHILIHSQSFQFLYLVRLEVEEVASVEEEVESLVEEGEEVAMATTLFGGVSGS